ncbi:hypothetical protein ACF058_26980 [Streptomyces sp. NPDC015501]|uniref:hypothetical protein n=1 Tax=unclassified Streptomyces TaxID=2593676 RepID=UPI0011A4B498
MREERVLSGLEVVAARYRELPAEERARSANALAPLLAEGTGYTVGTVRKYLGDIKRTATSSLDPGDCDRMGPEGVMVDGTGGVDAETRRAWRPCRARSRTHRGSPRTSRSGS